MSKMDWAFVSMIIVLVFLFRGEPDVFDALREKTIALLKEKS